MTKELKCPKCGSVFSVDAADYAQIADQVKTAEFNAEVARRLGESRHCAELEKASALQQKDNEIADLRRRLEGKDAEKLAALREKDLVVASTLAQKDLEAKEALYQKEAELARVRSEFQLQLKTAEEQVAFYKDMKARMSTKMIGESLEVHCATQFNQMLRPVMPRAYFEKDNDVVEGTKGDFIFRDYGEDGTEYVSIMFEMKNAADGTASKHKNEDFFKKLDADRTKKGCEFAVLVSLLEPDSELYNGGIVDVSYRYEKMYVIRPQFFLPLITLLVQTSKKSLAYKQALEVARKQSVDVTNFETKLLDFKDKFGNNCRLAKEKFDKAVAEIDKAIDALQKTKASLLGSENNIRLANDKLSDLSIRRLTHGNPTMREQFAAARAQARTENLA